VRMLCSKSRVKSKPSRQVPTTNGPKSSSFEALHAIVLLGMLKGKTESAEELIRDEVDEAIDSNQGQVKGRSNERTNISERANSDFKNKHMPRQNPVVRLEGEGYIIWLIRHTTAAWCWNGTELIVSV